MWFIVLAFLTIVAEPVLSQTEPRPLSDAAAVVRSVETQYQGNSSLAKMRMTIKTRSWTRTLEMESWSEGRDKMLTRILAPAKERGTCTLKVNDDIWNYIARVDRMIKIPSSLMGDSWMGSHLTNDDLVKENKVDKLYDLKISQQNEERIVITGVPLPEAAVVWGRIVYTIDAVKMVPLSVEYYDEAGAMVRTLVFSDVQQKDGRWLPMSIRIQPVEKPEEFTEMKYLEIYFSPELPADLFSVKSLRNR